MNARWMLLLLLTIALVPVANAQGGCTDSPENQTVVLALVGLGGALSAARLKSGWRR